MMGIPTKPETGEPTWQEFDNNYNTDLFSFDEEVSDVSSYDSSTLSTATGLDAFRDPRFIAELREYYSKKNKYFDNDADLIDEFTPTRRGHP